MTPRSLQSALRTLAGTPPASDADLLARFAAGDADAFADLVRRHGRLVWSACRSLTRSEVEADDAFQATFVVLLRHARKVKDPARLSSWLHGAAYRVCANARKAAARRAARERAAAVPEGSGQAVSGSAWDRALAAVHEAVPGLPEPLRVPFVLCCLEGVAPSEAARQLGWKPGTVDSRLSRAKDAVLARLEARGLVVGAVAGLSLLTPPTTAVAKAAALAHAGSVIPASLLTLSHGAVGMSMNPLKALTAAALVACGVGGGIGSGWVATAQAQRPGAAAAKPELEAEVQALRAKLAATEAALAQAKAQAEQPVVTGTITLTQPADVAVETVRTVTLAVAEPPAVRTARFEYLFVPVSGASQAKFGEILTQHEGRGWEYAGTTPLSDPKRDVWVFRRPVAAGIVALSADAIHRTPTLTLLTPSVTTPAPTKPAVPSKPAKPAAKATPEPAPAAVIEGRLIETPRTTEAKPLTAEGKPIDSLRLTQVRPLAVEGRLTETPAPTGVLGGLLTLNTAAAEAEKLQADIAALQAKLARLKPAVEPKPITITFGKEDSPLEPVTLGHLLLDLGQKKFGKAGRINVQVQGGRVSVTGDQKVADWAVAAVKSIKAN